MGKFFRAALKGVLAVILGFVSAEIYSFLVGNFIIGQNIFSDNDIGLNYVSFINIGLIVSTGFLNGFVTGSIARKYTVILSLISSLLPEILIFVVFLFGGQKYRNLSIEALNSHDAIWVWLGVIPAMVGGYVAARELRQDQFIGNLPRS